MTQRKDPKDKFRNVGLKIAPNMEEQVRTLAFARRTNFSEIIRQAIADYLAKHPDAAGDNKRRKSGATKRGASNIVDINKSRIERIESKLDELERRWRDTSPYSEDQGTLRLVVNS